MKRAKQIGLVVAPVVVTMLLLAGLTYDQLVLRVPPADAAPYHAAVHAAAGRIPFHIGDWFGDDAPVPAAAQQLLRPNAIVSRRYKHLNTGRTFDFVLVHCSDVRDILGHYPPVCYAAHGWTQTRAEPADWDLPDGLPRITGTSYAFETQRRGLPARITVYNFIMLPDGQVCRGMDEADRAAQDLRRKFLGAAQVQFVFDGAVPRDACDEVLTTVLAANRELIDAIRRRTDDAREPATNPLNG
jgi:hypothetical protein